MRKFTQIRVIAAVFATGLIGTSAVLSFAAENSGSPARDPGMMHQDGGMNHGDMKGMMNMMGQMSQMMDHCNQMMQEAQNESGKPNPQWKGNAPADNKN